MPSLDVRILGSKRNLDYRFFFSLGWYVNEFIQIISFLERSSFKLRCETVIGIVLCCCHKHVAFTIWAKLTVAFTCTSLPLNLYTFSDVVVVSDLNKYFGGSTDLAKKRHGSADLHTPIHPPLYG